MPRSAARQRVKRLKNSSCAVHYDGSNRGHIRSIKTPDQFCPVLGFESDRGFIDVMQGRDVIKHCGAFHP